MLNAPTNSRGPRSLSRIDALFGSVPWRGGGLSSPGALHQSQCVGSIADPVAELGAQHAALYQALGFPDGDPACAGIFRAGARADHATACITDWLSYLPRDCVRAMVKDRWHWTT